MKFIKLNYLKVYFIILALTHSFFSIAGTGTWASTTTGNNINFTITESTNPQKDTNGNYLSIIYLERLNLKKIGQKSNSENVNWLLSKGYRVIELDYSNNIKAISPGINSDIIAINKAINNGSFCGLTNCSKYRTWILFEGYLIARDISYFKDNPTVYNYPSGYTSGDSLYMDIIYPANPSSVVPVVLSFSYSNSYSGNIHQRLNLGNTLAGFNDSFLEGAPANGIAWAIADHPKYCDWGQGKPTGGANKAYGAYETNPDAAQKVKSAIRTLRYQASNLGLSDKIGIYGFSRGSTAGSMAIGDKSVSAFENAGLHTEINDDVQVAALGSGVFDYTLIFNTEESDVGNLRTNCPLGWGTLDSNRDLWLSQGSSYLVETSGTAPVIFFYNTDDALYYQDQIAKLKTKLTTLGVPNTTITNYGSGHAVPQTSFYLSTMYDFFTQYLSPPSVLTSLESTTISTKQSFDCRIVNKEICIKYCLKKKGNTTISIFDLKSNELFHTKKIDTIGEQNITIPFRTLNLRKGIYIVKVTSNDFQESCKIIL